MRTLLLTSGVITALATFALCAAGLWLNDSRWGATAYLVGIMSAASFCWGAFTPSHDDKCGGC